MCSIQILDGAFFYNYVSQIVACVQIVLFCFYSFSSIPLDI